MARNYFKQNKGFTMVELVVVIVIIAILVGVSVAGYSKYIGQAKINNDISNVHLILGVIQDAQVEPGVYEEFCSKSVGFTYTITINNEGASIGDYTADSPFMKAINDQLQMTDGVSEAMKMQAVKTYYAGDEYVITAEVQNEGLLLVNVSEPAH